MSFRPNDLNNQGGRRNARASWRRERIEADVEGRRLIKEARREEALDQGLPLPRRGLARLRALLRRDG